MSSATSCGSVLAIAVMRTVVGLYRRDKKQTPSLHTAQPMLSARGYASSCTDPPMPEHGVNLPRYLQIINLQIYVHANQSEGPWTTPRCFLPRGTAWKTEQSFLLVITGTAEYVQRQPPDPCEEGFGNSGLGNPTDGLPAPKFCMQRQYEVPRWHLYSCGPACAGLRRIP